MSELSYPNAPKPKQINLGLAISGALLPPGHTRTTTEIAAFCDCTKQMIHSIERRAIRKLRRAIKRELGFKETDDLIQKLYNNDE